MGGYRVINIENTRRYLIAKKRNNGIISIYIYEGNNKYIYGGVMRVSKSNGKAAFFFS